MAYELAATEAQIKLVRRKVTSTAFETIIHLVSNLTPPPTCTAAGVLGFEL